MLVDTFLLPRFLILELVFASHYLEHSTACNLVEKVMRHRTAARELQGPPANTSSDCSLRVWEQGWRHAPLLFSGPLAALPRALGRGRAEVGVREGGVLTLACPGGSVGSTGREEVGVRCGGSREGWRMEEQGVLLAELGCSKNPREAEVVEEDSYCGPEGRGLRLSIGFKFSQTFYPVLQVCHTSETEETHWVQHTVQGSSLAARGYDRGASNFKEGRVFYKRISANSAYTTAGQRSRLVQDFGEEKLEELFTTGFDRGHLAPDADFVFEDWQEATYYYANTAPQWSGVNRGNWKSVESAVRRLAAAVGELAVTTGTLGVLRLDRKEVWLGREDDTRRKVIPVPRVLWKIVSTPSFSSSIVILTLNNPLYRRVTRQQVFCPDICDESGWGGELDSRSSLEAGYTFCCSLDEFRKTVTWLPDSFPRDQTVLHFLS